MIRCKICGFETEVAFHTKILNRYAVVYYKCPKCFFIQSQEPFWIEESYKEGVSDFDIFTASRCLLNSKLSKRVIRFYFDGSRDFLDYGGGTGLMVRFMRDMGYNFYLSDPYCTNIFAKPFHIEGLNNSPRNFELVTAFEVFEHFQDPLKSIEDIFSYSKSVLFSTSLQPSKDVTPESWDYINPLQGQHISLYSIETLKFIAEKYSCNLYTNGYYLHLFTPKKLFLPSTVFLLLDYDRLLIGLRKRLTRGRKVSLESDYELIKKLNSKYDK